MIKRKFKNLSFLVAVMTICSIIPAPSIIEASTIVYSDSSNGLEWNFDDASLGVAGWSDGGSWDYKGEPIQIGYDNTIGNGALKLTVDYSKDSATSWSEVKISNTFSKSINFNEYNVLTYDFIYNPDNMHEGGFKAKLFIQNVADEYVDINTDESEELSGGLRKATVKIEFNSRSVDVDSIILGIIGCNTDYTGDLYIDNIRFEQVIQEGRYVEKVAVPVEQDVVDISDVNMENPVTLVDAESTETTASLYSYLKGIGQSEKVLYGHQNDTHHKAVLKDSGTNSDTKDITGSIAAIVGIDTLSLTGAELQLSDEEAASGLTYVEKAANLGIDAANEGGIITLSAHMPNFAVVAEKGVNVDGEYDYSGYTPGVTTGDVVSRIMPGGDLNDVFTGYLDIIAEYANILEANDVPVLFRPFHENNGSWFWWGKAFCDEEAYKNLFKYTVEYLRDTKNVHNFLYVYSPNGPFENKEDYLSRYPGDEFIDIIAFDMYHDNPLENPDEDPWMGSLKETIELVQSIADERGKLSAVSETGIRENYTFMPVSGNPNKKWFENVSDIISESNMPYYMVWANFGENDGIFAPYMVDETHGHEMINDFINYYNDPKSVFANGVGNYRSAKTSISEAYSYGYITSPSSNSRVLQPTTITASVKNLDGNITFVIKNNNDDVVVKVDAVEENGVFKADITKEMLDKIGQTIGTIELYCQDDLLNSVRVLFNIEESESSKNLVDDFESYYGEEALLGNVWATNAGPGCYIKPTLTSEEGKYSEGNYGLVFNYKISNAKTSEGWAGITKTIGKDWSEYDALQFWVTPDGKGQKLVIQVTTNGEDFEVIAPELASSTEPQLVTLKFSDFVGKNGGVIDLSNVERFGIWCNTLPEEGHTGEWTVESTMYFDNIKAIDTTAVVPGDDNKDDEDNKPGNDNNNETPEPDEGTDDGKNEDNANNIIAKPSTDKKNNGNSGNKKIPNTGGANSLAILGLGSIFAVVGSLLKRKK